MDDQGAFSPFAPLTISDIPFFGMSLSFYADYFASVGEYAERLAYVTIR